MHLAVRDKPNYTDPCKQAILEDGIKDTRSRIDDLEMIRHLPDGLPFEGLCTARGKPRLIVPYDFEQLALCKKLLCDAGWKFVRETDDNDIGAYKWMTFRREIDGGIFYLDALSYLSVRGSTCKRVVLGTEMVEKEVVEIICGEGAAEEAL